MKVILPIQDMEILPIRKPLKLEVNIDLYLHVLKSRIFDRHGFGSMKSTQLFCAKIEKINPDIIHLHNIHGYYLNIECII